MELRTLTVDEIRRAVVGHYAPDCLARYDRLTAKPLVAPHTGEAFDWTDEARLMALLGMWEPSEMAQIRRH